MCRITAFRWHKFLARENGKKRSDSHNDKREKVTLAELTLRRSIGVGAKSFEVTDKTSTGAIARTFPVGVKDSSEILKLFRIDRRPSREVTPRFSRLSTSVDYVYATRQAVIYEFSMSRRVSRIKLTCRIKEFSFIFRWKERA